MAGFTKRDDNVIRATKEHPSKRKPHSWWAGYIAERRNSISGGHNVLVDAGKAMLDTTGGRWAVVCNEHGTILNHTNQRMLRATALASSESSVNWCDECRELFKAETKPNGSKRVDYGNSVVWA